MNSKEVPHDESVRFATGIGPTTDKILNTLIDRFTSGDFREKLTDRIVDPITNMINDKIRPYIYVCIGLYFIVILLLIVIIWLLIKKPKATR